MRFPTPLAAPMLAAGLACAAGHAAHAETLNVVVNHSLRLPVTGRAASVVLGNAGLADVAVIDSHTLFVTGKSPGSTDLTVVDPLGRTVYAAEVEVSRPGGAAVTIHRANVTSELACSPRCDAGEGRATGMAAVMQGVMDMASARQAAAAGAASAPAGALGGLSFAGPPQTR